MPCPRGQRDAVVVGDGTDNGASGGGEGGPTVDDIGRVVMHGGSSDGADGSVQDLQALAMSTMSGSDRRQPGLKLVAERWLGKTMDKAMQCSDWDTRPLSRAQLHYAAADAAVLLDVAAAMGIAFHHQ